MPKIGERSKPVALLFARKRFAPNVPIFRKKGRPYFLVDDDLLRIFFFW